MDKIGSKDNTSVWTRHRKNVVVLGNDVSVSFTNEKHAKVFLVQVNREINFKIDDLNLLYIELFREYRVIWRALDPVESYKVIEINSQIDKFLTRAVEKSQTENGNHFVFAYIGKAIIEMRTLIEMLGMTYKRLNSWHSKRMIASYLVRLEAIKNELENIGKKG